MKFLILTLSIFLLQKSTASSLNFDSLVICADSNCEICYGTGEDQCTRCNSNTFLKNGKCVTDCDVGSDVYITDPYDRTCKKTRYAYDFHCPAGTYNILGGKSSLSDCLKCPDGFYCPGIGNKDGPSNCKAGYFCVQGADVGAIVELNDDASASAPYSYTQPCGEGFYCPTGSPIATQCPAGYYCVGDRRDAPNGACKAGYICNAGSRTPTPGLNAAGSDANGYRCPKGHYCEEGATKEKACPVGTYLNRRGGEALSDCVKCPAGKFCDQSGADNPKGDCAPGYYCPAGSTTSTPAAYRCPIGHECPGGNAVPTPCEPSKYQDKVGQTSCIHCDPGYYCYDGTKITECPAGSYCPGSNQIFHCPPGKYKDTVGGDTDGACKTCLAGLVCELAGTVSPSIPCAPGYYCLAGSKTRFPTSTTGGKCEPGYYCPERSSAQMICPAGEYCATAGLASSSGKCQEGYYCEEGATSSRDKPCSPGHYCPEGSAKPIRCPRGTYGPLTGASKLEDCISCDMGVYCEDEGIAEPGARECHVGYYCPLNQLEGDPASYICPKGYMCPQGSKAPTPCAAGTYQPSTGASTCEACPERYYCDGVDGSQKIECPRGYYCPQGTKVPSEHPCPVGTYSANLLMKDDSGCEDCPAGYYCQEKGQSAYADLCA